MGFTNNTTELLKHRIVKSNAQIEARMTVDYYKGVFTQDNPLPALEYQVTSITTLQDNEGNTPAVETRNIIVDTLFDAYVEQTGKVPRGAQVQRLANWIMLETMTDSRPDKVAREEYPVLTKRQTKTRHYRERTMPAGTDGDVTVILDHINQRQLGNVAKQRSTTNKMKV